MQTIRVARGRSITLLVSVVGIVISMPVAAAASVSKVLNPNPIVVPLHGTVDATIVIQVDSTTDLPLCADGSQPESYVFLWWNTNYFGSGYNCGRLRHVDDLCVNNIAESILRGTPRATYRAPVRSGEGL